MSLKISNFWIDYIFIGFLRYFILLFLKKPLRVKVLKLHIHNIQILVKE